jgi:hypothetical protein
LIITLAFSDKAEKYSSTELNFLFGIGSIINWYEPQGRALDPNSRAFPEKLPYKLTPSIPLSWKERGKSRVLGTGVSSLKK